MDKKKKVTDEPSKFVSVPETIPLLRDKLFG